MLLAIVIAVSMTPLSLDEGHLKLSVPSNVQVREQRLNFETAEWDLYEPGNALPILQIVDGGGSYDLSSLDKGCLNGRPSWRHDDGGSGTVVVGEPGSWAVAAYWENLSGQRLTDAKTIVSSIEIDFGGKC